MRDVYKEYKQGLISWGEAYLTANNLAALSSDGFMPTEETEYWCKQMESLGIETAEEKMNMLGYEKDQRGVFYQ